MKILQGQLRDLIQIGIRQKDLFKIRTRREKQWKAGQRIRTDIENDQLRQILDHIDRLKTILREIQPFQMHQASKRHR